LINATVKQFQQRGQPVISVDTRKVELVGPVKGEGHEWHPGGEPEQVQVREYLDMDLAKTRPFGAFDLSQNEGWGHVTFDPDTARFAAQAIHRWWKKMGAKLYGNARELLITAVGGSCNESRSRMWKVALQELAIRLKIPIRVFHFPSGTHKWSKIEHRMFCQITKDRSAQPEVSHEVIIQLIAGTTTRAGLNIHVELEPGFYPTRTWVDHQELDLQNLKRSDFRGAWNYSLFPTPR
jgi:hypothetical protein